MICEFYDFCKNLEPMVVCVTFFIGIIRYFVNYYYCYKCETTYGIPKKYFSINIIDKIFESLLICILALFCYYALDFNFFGMFLIIFLSLIILMIIFLNNYSFISKIFKDDKRVISYLLFSVAFSILVVVAKYFCDCLYRVFLVVLLLFFILAIFDNFANLGIKKKSQYEICIINNEEYLVLSNYNNNYICVKYEYSKNQNTNILKLLTKEYFIISLSNVKVIKKDFANNKNKFELEVL